MMVANENFDGEEMEFETISLWETDVDALTVLRELAVRRCRRSVELGIHSERL